jgi:hypothetical protein
VFNSRVEFLLMAVLEQDLVQPVLKVLVLQAALRELTLLLAETALPERSRGGRRGRRGVGLQRDAVSQGGISA